MTRHLPLPPDLNADGFRIAAAQRLGVSTERLRAGELFRPFHGVRSIDPPHSPLQWARAYRGLLRTNQCFGEHTAAAILGVPHRDSMHTKGIVVVSPIGTSHPRRPGVIARRIDPQRLAMTEVDGLPTTSPALTWLMLGRTHSIAELVVAGDALVATAAHYPGRGTEPLATLEELGLALAAAGQIPGIARLKRAYPLVRTASESPRESLLRYLIIERGLPEPVLQFEHADVHTGRVIGRSDMFWPFARLAVEYEGDGHREAERWDKDIRKYRRLERQGILTLRATAADLAPSPDAWLDDLAIMLAARA